MEKKKSIGSLIAIIAVAVVLMLLVAMGGRGAAETQQASGTAAAEDVQSEQTTQDTQTEDAQDTQITQDTQTEDAQDTQTTQDTSSGTLGDYQVSIDTCETVEDYEGNPAACVTFTFTNNSEESISFGAAIYTQAFQDGVELDTAFVGSDEEGDAYKDIKPGTTISCTEYYTLTSDTADLEVEATDIWSLNNQKLQKTFTRK